MPINNPTGSNPTADSASAFGQQASETVRDIKQSMSDAARTASAKVEANRVAAADTLEGAASTVRQRADELPGGARVQELAHAAADRISTTADYLRTTDASRMRSDVETMVKNNPGPALLLAAAVGFLLSRALSRD